MSFRDNSCLAMYSVPTDCYWEKYSYGPAAFPMQACQFPWQPTPSTVLPSVESLYHTGALTVSPSSESVYSDTTSPLASRSPCALSTTSPEAWKEQELSSIGSKPLFTDLQSTLQSDCSKSSVPSTLLDIFQGATSVTKIDVPLTVKISTLHLRFATLCNRFHSRVEDLKGMYRMQAAEIETERYRALCQMQDVPHLETVINQRYDQRHLALIARIETSLELLEQKQQQDNKTPCVVKKEASQTSCATAEPPREYKPYQKHNNFVGFNAVAVRIMTNWYERNKEHPYPSYDSCEIMAKACKLEVEQVKKWFANKRMRERNTKSLTEIAGRRKRRTKTESKEVLKRSQE